MGSKRDDATRLFDYTHQPPNSLSGSLIRDAGELDEALQCNLSAMHTPQWLLNKQYITVVGLHIIG